MRSFIALFLLIALASCYKFTGNQATIQVGSGDARPAKIIADTAAQRQEIQYLNFDVDEHELFDDNSRFQTCPSGGCANYFVSYPMVDYGNRNNKIQDNTNVNGEVTDKYRVNQGSYQADIWVLNSDINVIVKVVQTGPNFSRTMNFDVDFFSTNVASFSSLPSDPNCATVVCDGALDIIIVLDASGSIDPPDYDDEREFARNIVSSFTVNENAVNIGVITFATAVYERIGLSSSVSAINGAIDGAAQQTGQTNIGGAILSARSELAQSGRNGGIPQLIVLVTDGVANEPQGEPISPITYMLQQAQAAKDDGIIIYAIGVGNGVSESDLQQISSGSGFTAFVNQFDELLATITGIQEEVCVGGVEDSCAPACGDNFFCGCTDCICTLNADHCKDSNGVSRGTFNPNTCQCESCVSPYSNSGGVDDCSSCAQSCVRGSQDEFCVCDCPNLWDGSTCNECNVSCGPNFRELSNCAGCSCPASGTGWTGDDCNECSPSFCDNGGVANANCDSCTCTGDWLESTNCATCGFDCSNRGIANSNCDGCICNNNYGGDNCELCTRDCNQGNNQGNPNQGCNRCICNNEWSGNKCQNCNYCSHGSADSTCSSCACENLWSGDTCNSCNLDCENNTDENSDCSGCACTGETSGQFCEFCDESVCVNGEMDDCSIPRCTCPDNFQGNLCNECNVDLCNGRGSPVDENTCLLCACEDHWIGDHCETCNADVCINGQINNRCDECICEDFWTGDFCEVCDNADEFSAQCRERGVLDATCENCLCPYPWDGETCGECVFECNQRGSPNNNCDACECEDGWSGLNCEECLASDPNDFCGGHGTILDLNACNVCDCVYPHGGNDCSECVFECNQNGSPLIANCDGCDCFDAWGGENCNVCDDAVFSLFCNSRGFVSNGECNECTCTEAQWEGSTCNICPIICENGGFANDSCTGCVCQNEWDASTNCVECSLECSNGGGANDSCTACECTGGYTSESLCADCDTSYFDNCENNANGLSNCECDCSDRWGGDLCGSCPLSIDNGDCGAPVNGGIINFTLNNIPQCRCECAEFYEGDDCQICSLAEGTSVCDGISEPDFENCTCHCPQYYAEEEGCRTCIIVDEDCVHPLPGTIVDDSPEVCSCFCDGNWEGRDCSVCAKECDESAGWYLDDTICECVTHCHDGILVEPEEECELALIGDEKDKTCCRDCFLIETSCDDQASCTFDDRCFDGICEGLGSIDFEIDQDRNPLPLGSFSNAFWERWGVVVSTSGSIDIEVYDSENISENEFIDPRFTFPSTLVSRGGDNTFGRILKVTSPNPSFKNPVCFTFSSPMEVESTILLSVAKDTSSVDFYCSGSLSDTPKNVPLCAWGIGSMQPAYNPCEGPVNKICYNELADAAIASIYMCEDPFDHLFGSIGDYVWHDFTVDNIQDSIEIGIPDVHVELKDSAGVQITNQDTGSNGEYLFAGLYPDTYTVVFYGPDGYRYSTPVELLNSNILHNAQISEIELAEGQDILTIDVGLYLFGAIGDYIFLDENRNGIQDESVGVEGVTLELFTSDDLINPIMTTSTSSIGDYLFNNLSVFKTATTYVQYFVKMTPPENAIVTIANAGSSDIIDSDFDPITYWSPSVTLTPLQTTDLSIDGGIYFCCGSVGDFVFFDSDLDGLQTGESAVPFVVVRLFMNDEPIASTMTNTEGYYLFEGLALGDFDYRISFERPDGYIFTQQGFDNSNELIDSDVDASGDTAIFHLTVDEPHIRYIDAGVKVGCEDSGECGSANLCQRGVCRRGGVCNFEDATECAAPANECYDSFCEPSTGNCIAVPTTEVDRFCNDLNDCTVNDVCGNNGVCSGTPSNNPCDDGDDCTENDLCGPDGECVGVIVDCTSDDICIESHCEAGECVESFTSVPCDDGFKCTGNDVCILGECAGTPLDCSVSDDCLIGSCEESSGDCVVDNTSGDCDDGSQCTVDDSCEEGICVGIPMACENISECHDTYCLFGDCVSDFVQQSCNDNDACTVNDQCNPNTEACEGTPKDCEDNNPCTITFCRDGDCIVEADSQGTCDDGDSCTTSQCVDLSCVHTPIKCSDDNICTNDVCVGGECQFIDNTIACNDENPCTVVDMCSLGVCSGSEIQCDDGNVCTDDFCDVATGLCATSSNTETCDDGNECTPTDLCVEGLCTGFDLKTCSEIELDVCQIASCDSITGNCIPSNIEDETSCDDGDLCTISSCSAGVCVGNTVDCDDSDLCTDDSCVNGQCINIPTAISNVSCDDGDECTVDDVCVSGVCIGVARDCGDGNACSDDECVAGECIHTPNKLSCDDGINCTVNDVCADMECSGTSVVCNASPCFDNECEESTGACVQTPNTEECDDSNSCTSNDVCDGGVCAGEVSIECESENECLVGECDIISGSCSFVAVTDNTSCDDGDSCTENDFCVSGVCHGTRKECDDGNFCTDDQCVEGECVFTNNSISCDDNNRCTTVDECVEGECQGFLSIDCSSDNVCIESLCNINTGECEESNVDVECNDNDICTANDICDNGICRGTPTDCDECVLSSDCEAHENLCLGVSCVEGACVYENSVDCSNDDPCVISSCNPDSGNCDIETFTDSECDDFNPCSKTDVCISGTCTGTESLVCEERLCSVGVCNVNSGECDYDITIRAPCNDEDSCTVNDECTPNGECSGTPISCDDGNFCTDDVCVEGVCQSTNNSNSCNDADLCTSNDICDNGECSGTPITCDADKCHDAECSSGVCVQTPNVEVCDDGNACTLNDVCFNGQCAGELLVCESDDLCTDATCVNGSCSFTSNTSACDDGDFCTENDRCVSGACIGRDIDCSHLDAECGEGVCMQGECTFVSDEFEGLDCDSNNQCTENNVCEAGECVGSAITCENNNPCSIGSCDPNGGCIFENINVSCESGNLCQVSVCIDQECVDRDNSVDCDDQNECTIDSCNPIDGGCIFTFNSAIECSDGNPCTVDLCTPNGCESTTIECDDNNECTNDSCVNGECVFVPNNEECEIDDFCVSQARCTAGVCTAISDTFCPNDGPCAIGFCDSDAKSCGFRAVEEQTSCSDNNDCTADDFCQSDLSCVGSTIECEPSVNPCQSNVCNPEGGCTLVPNPEGDCSVSDDVCSTHSCSPNGVCVASFTECVDDNLCTIDNFCDPESGCEFIEYSCILSPCVFLGCDGLGECIVTGNSDAWNPLVYIALTNPEGENYITAISSADGNYSDFIEVVDPILSISVHPTSGKLFVTGGSEGRSILSIGKRGGGKLDDELDVITADTGIPALDLSFKPRFRRADTGYSYRMWGLSRGTTSQFYEINRNSQTFSEISGTPTNYEVSSWDNHGFYLFGIVGKQLHGWNPSTGVDEVLCNGVEFVPEGDLISIDIRVDETLAGAVQQGADLHVFTVDFRVNTFDTVVCDIRTFTVVDAALFATTEIDQPTDEDDEIRINTITAVAFDDTVCASGGNGGSTGSSGGGGNGGGGDGAGNNSGGDGGSGGSDGGANLTPPSGGTANPPSASGGSNFPGDDTNYVLTGTEGQVSATVIGAVGAGSVALFAVFAVLFGLNNTKKEPTVPMGALLESTEASNLASENPIFQNPAGASSNILA